MQTRGIDILFLWMQSKPFFYRFTLFTRLLLSAGFLPTGMVKLMGERFTLISPETSIGYFFEALYQTGFYWRFIGGTQVLAALLLLFPITAHLGAAIFFPVMINIFVVTVSLSFTGTPVVTGLMVLAVTYLLFWDYPRFRSLIFRSPSSLPRLPIHRLDRWERVGFTLFGVCLVATFFGTRFGPIFPVFPVLAFLGGLLALLRFLVRNLIRPAARS